MKVIKRFKNKKHHCARCLKIPKFLLAVSGASARLCKECATSVIEECS